MMNRSKIEWCHFTWNPVTGCLHGCPYCYAAKQAKRFSGDIRLNKGSDQLQKDEHGLYVLEKPSSFTGDLIAEYGHFFLFRGKNGYRFTIGKNELHCGHYSMEKVGGGAK